MATFANIVAARKKRRAELVETGVLEALIGNGNNQYRHDAATSSNSKVEINHYGGTTTYKLSSAASAMREHDDFVYESDLLPSLDGQRMAGISDTENARKADAVKTINQLVQKFGLEGRAVAITYNGRRVGVATLSKEALQSKDFKSFMTVAGKYFGSGTRSMSAADERMLGKFLGFPTKSTDKYVSKVRGLAAGSIGFRFDRTNPKAVEKVRQQAADLITSVSKTTREEIKELVEQAFTDPDMDVHDLADQIDEIIDDSARAETIARTETMSASNAGQLAAWDQAEEDGLLTGDEQKEWITTPDDRVCPICEPMDGVTVGRDENFDVDGEEMDGPPAHPNCRCTLGLSI